MELTSVDSGWNHVDRLPSANATRLARSLILRVRQGTIVENVQKARPEVFAMTACEYQNKQSRNPTVSPENFHKTLKSD